MHVTGAAAFPSPVRCNPMATCYLVGWRLGELLAKGDAENEHAHTATEGKGNLAM